MREFLVTARKKQNLSQKELGEILGVNQNTISNWENGSRMPRGDTMRSLIEILKINPKDFYISHCEICGKKATDYGNLSLCDKCVDQYFNQCDTCKNMLDEEENNQSFCPYCRTKL